MNAMTKTFDPKCYDLAFEFCPDGTPDSKIRQLALTIQDTIEDWLDMEQRLIDLKQEAGDQRAK